MEECQIKTKLYASIIYFINKYAINHFNEINSILMVTLKHLSRIHITIKTNSKHNNNINIKGVFIGRLI